MSWPIATARWPEVSAALQHEYGPQPDAALQELRSALDEGRRGDVPLVDFALLTDDHGVAAALRDAAAPEGAPSLLSPRLSAERVALNSLGSERPPPPSAPHPLEEERLTRTIRIRGATALRVPKKRRRGAHRARALVVLRRERMQRVRASYQVVQRQSGR